MPMHTLMRNTLSRPIALLLAVLLAMPSWVMGQPDSLRDRVSTPQRVLKASPGAISFSRPQVGGSVSVSPELRRLLVLPGVGAIPLHAGAAVEEISGPESGHQPQNRTRSSRVIRDFERVNTNDAAAAAVQPGSGGVRSPSSSGRRTMIMGGGPGGGDDRITALGEAEHATRPGNTTRARPESPGAIAVTGVEGLVVTLGWSDRSGNETGFSIEHQVRIGSSWSGSGTYSVAAGRETAQITVTPGSHRFRVAAVGDGGTSRWTAWSSAVEVSGSLTPPPSSAPSAPANLTVTQSESSTVVTVRWDDTSGNESGFEIERSPAFSTGTRAVDANVSSTTDQVVPGTYQYRVRSFNADGASVYTAWGQVVVTYTPPAPPSSPAARDDGNERDIRFQWVDASDNEERFVIERQRQVGSFWGEPATLEASANATSIVDPVGFGTFRYRVASVNGIGTSAFTSWASATVTANGGWTDFTPSADTRIVYVSSSEGLDTNDGLSPERPKQTIAAGYAVLRHGYPDWMLLKRGDVWDSSLGHWRKSGRSASEMMVVGTFGSAVERPLLRTGTGAGFRRMGGGGSPPSIDNLAVTGLSFVPHLRTTENPTGFSWVDSGQNVLIEDCRFEGYAINIAIQGFVSTVHNVSIRRCAVVGAYGIGMHSQGIYINNSTNVLIEECVIDHNGWREGIEGAGPTIYNHNVYVQTNCRDVIFRRNICARASSHGIQLRSGGIVEDNVFVRCALACLLGGGTTDPETHTLGVTGRVSGNVVLEGVDISPELPRGYGIDLSNIGMLGATVEDNIIANKVAAASSPAIQLIAAGNGAGVGCNNITIADNIVYAWRGGLRIGAPPSTPPTPSEFASVQGNTIVGNQLQDLIGSTTHPLISVHSVTACEGELNRYSSSRSSGQWFSIAGQNRSMVQWLEQMTDNGSTDETIVYPDPHRTLGAYNSLIGGEATLEAFLEDAGRRHRLNWNTSVSSGAVRQYLREGFGRSE